METVALFSIDGIPVTAKYGDRNEALTYRSHTPPPPIATFTHNLSLLKPPL